MWCVIGNSNASRNASVIVGSSQDRSVVQCTTAMQFKLQVTQVKLIALNSMISEVVEICNILHTHTLLRKNDR